MIISLFVKTYYSGNLFDSFLSDKISKEILKYEILNEHQFMSSYYYDVITLDINHLENSITTKHVVDTVKYEGHFSFEKETTNIIRKEKLRLLNGRL